jgi:hypothetical protein
MARRQYKGAAVKTRLSANIGAGDTSFGIISAAGWPTGGANGEFTITIDPDTSTEERCRVGSLSGTTLNTVVRGVDDTTAVPHSAGADGTVIHSFSAQDANEANRHIFDTTLDEHTQYMKTDGTRHDLSARHTYGAALGTRPTPIATGTSLLAGSGAAPAAGDHQHTIGAGSINSAGMFAAGVVDAAAIGADQVGSSEIAPLAVTSAELASNAVTVGKIGSAAIDDQGLFAADTQPWIVQAANPGTVGANRIWFNTTKETVNIRNAGDTAWRTLFNMGPSVQYTPAVDGVTLGSSLNYARYTRFGRYIIINGFLKFGTGAGISGNIAVGMPSTAVGADYRGTYADEFFSHGAGRASINGLGYAAVSVLGHGTVTYTPTRLGFFATAGYAAWNATTPASWVIGDRFSWFAEVECASAEDANFI